ncbi:MAG TPA: hypothetical protein VD864_15030, partial [Nocardioides sp.]|nr:hypothetical protein [Nocardioides sp.]
MTLITYVGAGAAATGNNASVAPALPAGLAAGDLMLLHASIRNSGTGTVDTPTGWTQLYGSGTNHAVFGRWWQSGDAAPTVSFTGGAAGADTIGQVAAIRGAAPGSLLEPAALESLLNASAQNVAYPATSPPADN